MLAQSAVNDRPEVPARQERAVPAPSLIIAIAVTVGLAVWIVHGQLDPRLLTLRVGNDAWFEADLPTVADNMLHRWSDQSRNARHPLFPMFATLPTYALRAVGLSDATALRLLLSVVAAGWGAALCVVAWLVTGRRFDALVFTALTCVSSAAVFWLAVPETYAWGSLTLLLALALCGIDRGARLHPAWYTGSAVLCLGVTSSNWMAAAFGAGVRHRWTRALQILANSLSIVVVLWAVQRMVFPTTEFFLGYTNESRFITPPAAGGPLRVARVLFFHSIVMPTIQIVDEPRWGAMMSVQQSQLGGTGTIGVAATLLWAVMLGFAARGLVASGVERGLRLALGLTLAAQVLLHQVYGEETFLYTLHVAPLMILAAAASTRTRQRRLVLGVAVVLIALLLINNARQFATANQFFEWAPGASERR
jgi:hypothetical protein